MTPTLTRDRQGSQQDTIKRSAHSGRKQYSKHCSRRQRKVLSLCIRKILPTQGTFCSIKSAGSCLWVPAETQLSRSKGRRIAVSIRKRYKECWPSIDGDILQTVRGQQQFGEPPLPKMRSTSRIHRTLDRGAKTTGTPYTSTCWQIFDCASDCWDNEQRELPFSR